MTIGSTTNQVPYTGDGVSLAFAYPSPFITAADIKVTVAGAPITTGFTVTGVADIAGSGAFTSGTVTFAVAPTAGAAIIIYCDPDQLQSTTLLPNDPLPAKSVEKMVDKVTLLIQRIRQTLSQAILFPIGDTPPTLPPASQRAGLLWGFDGAGNFALIVAAAQSATALALSMLGNTGATLMNYLAPFTGTFLRSQHLKNTDSVNSAEFSGIDPTGVADSTTGMQAFFTACRLQSGNQRIGRLHTGTYKITAAISTGSNISIEFEPGVIFDASGLPNETTSLFNVAAQTSVYMEGNGAVLKGARATAVVEGNSAAFFLYGAKNVDIRNFQIQDFATDGITVTGDNSGSGPCENVVIYNCKVSNCRRNGMSIISAKGCTVIGGEYKTSNGAPAGPFAGIDIEPNSNSFLQGVELINVRTSGNLGPGIQVTPGALSTNGAASTQFELTITGGRSFNDGTVNTVNKAGLMITAGGAWTNKVTGFVKVNGFTVDSPMDRGVALYNWDADLAPPVSMYDCDVYDPDFTLSGAGNDNRTAYVISADATQAVTNLGNITLRSCRATDRRVSPRMTRGFELGTSGVKVLKNILIVDPTSVNYTAATKVDVYTDASAIAGGMLNVDVVYTTPRVVAVSGTGNIGSFLGPRLNFTVSLNATLPPAANCPGAHCELQTDIGVNSVSILPAAGDTIKWLVDVSSTNLVLDDNAVVVLRSRGGTSWVVEEVNGKTRVAGNSIQGQTIWTTAIPSTGTHAQGDRALNKSSTVGSPKAWDCTVTGSPGTWVSEGNL